MMRMQENQIISFYYHHVPFFTCAEAEVLKNIIPGAHSKNPFLRNGAKFFLVSILEHQRVELKARASLLKQKKISFGNENGLYQN